VTDDFSLLFELLEYSAQEVAGRAAPTISPEVREKLAKLATGRCNDQERYELLTLLEQQPDLVPTLVREIKNLRNPQNVRSSGRDK
jgi:hypothetical protein